jgi:alpha-galactosidase
MKRRIILCLVLFFSALLTYAQDGTEPAYRKWALTPPMGWNSWDCYGPTVNENEVLANAKYIRDHLKQYGWQYVVVDIRWYISNPQPYYNTTNPIYNIDAYGRYTPAVNRFPSAANGMGFKALADSIHAMGLKFGIHMMRGLPIQAAKKKLPVLGGGGITCDQICNNDSACTWLYDNYKVKYTPQGQLYYNSLFDSICLMGCRFCKDRRPLPSRTYGRNRYDSPRYYAVRPSYGLLTQSR